MNFKQHAALIHVSEKRLSDGSMVYSVVVKNPADDGTQIDIPCTGKIQAEAIAYSLWLTINNGVVSALLI